MKNTIKKPVIILITVFLLMGVIYTGAKLYIGGKNGEIEGASAAKKQKVQTADINIYGEDISFIETVGTVNAETQIDIVASTRGNVRSLLFEVGDEVDKNQILAFLYDSTSLTNLNNAQTNLTNTENNLLAAERLTNETIKQAEIGVKSAEESIRQAEIGLKAAQDNLANAASLKEKNKLDAKNNAIIAYNGFLNNVFTSLDQVNEIIKLENKENTNNSNINPNFSARDLNVLRNVKIYYLETKKSYDVLSDISPNINNIADTIQLMVGTLSETEQMINYMIQALDKTVTGTNYPESLLNSQKANFITLRSSIVGSQTSAKSIQQNLQNLDLYENQEIAALENAVKAAENQLAIAETGYANSLVALENAKQAKKQQVFASQSSVDNARGQLNLAQVQVGDLSIKTPIHGVVTQKYIEIGTEVNPGQKIAEISQNNNLSIVVNLPSEQIYRIKENQEVSIGEGLIGTIKTIAPAADPITKKVKVEILYNNENQDLIQGTFIDVSIPVEALKKTHEQSVFIPLRAVAITQNESYVFVVQENKAKKTNVVTGKTEGALIEILNGLNHGDELIVENAKNLEDGDEIEITN